MPDKIEPLAREVLGCRGALEHNLDALDSLRVHASRIRCHGDYHLGQVLKTADGFAIYRVWVTPLQRRQFARPVLVPNSAHFHPRRTGKSCLVGAVKKCFRSSRELFDRSNLGSIHRWSRLHMGRTLSRQPRRTNLILRRGLFAGSALRQKDLRCSDLRARRAK